MVEVLNSTPEPDGSRKTYFLRVPPDIRRRARGRRLDVRALVRHVRARDRDLADWRLGVRIARRGVAASASRRSRRSSLASYVVRMRCASSAKPSSPSTSRSLG